MLQRLSCRSNSESQIPNWSKTQYWLYWQELLMTMQFLTLLMCVYSSPSPSLQTRSCSVEANNAYGSRGQNMATTQRKVFIRFFKSALYGTMHFPHIHQTNLHRMLWCEWFLRIIIILIGYMQKQGIASKFITLMTEFLRFIVCITAHLRVNGDEDRKRRCVEWWRVWSRITSDMRAQQRCRGKLMNGLL